MLTVRWRSLTLLCCFSNRYNWNRFSRQSILLIGPPTCYQFIAQIMAEGKPEYVVLSSSCWILQLCIILSTKQPLDNHAWVHIVYLLHYQHARSQK